MILSLHIERKIMAQWSALKVVVDDLNSHEKPYEEFSAFMVFVLSSLKNLDGEQMSDACQEAFLYVESRGLAAFEDKG